MADATILKAVKLSMGLTVLAYDAEIMSLIDAAVLDLQLALGKSVNIGDPLVAQAIKTYCRMSFRSPADYDRLRASYEAQKGQLQIATGYTNWGDLDDQG
jgi:hypothetical protein